mmetsp:Transcript_57413/g.123455  ORF Transcript_57413/g.123455 Transcript_57413/m.123455 type:complete len:305 (+) Transcript_57413:545-1459(+)
MALCKFSASNTRACSFFRLRTTFTTLRLLCMEFASKPLMREANISLPLPSKHWRSLSNSQATHIVSSAQVTSSPGSHSGLPDRYAVSPIATSGSNVAKQSQAASAGSLTPMLPLATMTKRFVLTLSMSAPGGNDVHSAPPLSSSSRNSVIENPCGLKALTYTNASSAVRFLTLDSATSSATCVTLAPRKTRKGSKPWRSASWPTPQISLWMPFKATITATMSRLRSATSASWSAKSKSVSKARLAPSRGFAAPCTAEFNASVRRTILSRPFRFSCACIATWNAPVHFSSPEAFRQSDASMEESM